MYIEIEEEEEEEVYTRYNIISMGFVWLLSQNHIHRKVKIKCAQFLAISKSLNQAD